VIERKISRSEKKNWSVKLQITFNNLPGFSGLASDFRLLRSLQSIPNYLSDFWIRLKGPSSTLISMMGFEPKWH